MFAFLHQTLLYLIVCSEVEQFIGAMLVEDVVNKPQPTQDLVVPIVAGGVASQNSCLREREGWEWKVPLSLVWEYLLHSQQAQ